MASSKSAEDNFRARVNKIFGSLTSSQNSSVRPPWSLTDDEVEKREWRRHKDDNPNRDDETPCSSSFDSLFKKDNRFSRKNSRNIGLEDLDDDDDDDEQIEGDSEHSFERGDGADREEWNIRSSIGLDCTLDNEEEEDEYDKLAEGRENGGDRLYMRDVTDHGPYLNSHNVLPNSIHDAARDSRADYDSAQIRLKEDETSVEDFDSNQTFGKSMLNVEKPCIIASEVGVKPKSILKRKDDATVKSLKRVRFDPACKDDCEEALGKYQDCISTSDCDSFLAENMPRVPDYVLNPSRYTHYSFDWSSDIDDDSNVQAYMNFSKPTKRSKTMVSEGKLEDAAADLPKPVMFIPRKKTSDAEAAAANGNAAKLNNGDSPKQSLTQTAFTVGIAAGQIHQNEVGDVGEDEPEIDTAGRRAGLQKPGRHYRMKTSLEDTIS